MTNRRYLVILLMFLSIFVNYMDRVNFSVSIPAIRHQFGFSLQAIGWILFAWGIAYAIFNFPGGWLVDRLGLRRALPLTLGWWSIFTIGTPLAGSFAGWCIVRALMGVGEAPIWPINAKCANTWAAPGERSTLYTWAGSGQFLGPAVGTFLAGLILVHFGWQWTFVAFGLLGLAILPFWFFIVRDRPALDPRVNVAEIAHIGNHAAPNEQPDWPGIRDVILSRTGIGMLLIYLTFGYILFTFIYWMPPYMFYTFHMGTLDSAKWASLAALLGFAGFILSGPLNDRLVARFDRLTARRIGTAAPMLCAVVFVVFSLLSARAGLGGFTALLLGLAQLSMNLTVGAWAVNVIDISPNGASTGFVYGIYNGALNIMGAVNSIILTALAVRFGFPAAFGSAIAFMLVFVVGILWVVDRPSYTALLAHAELARNPDK
ncbi:MAG TPA: MFS transporter [Verrucomicrobiae bacterium]|jgi:MFS family permease|nr:MFS transporter [Verrucomicrobiae bacterium]